MARRRQKHKSSRVRVEVLARNVLKIRFLRGDSTNQHAAVERMAKTEIDSFRAFKKRRKKLGALPAAEGLKRGCSFLKSLLEYRRAAAADIGLLPPPLSSFSAPLSRYLPKQETPWPSQQTGNTRPTVDSSCKQIDVYPIYASFCFSLHLHTSIFLQ